MKKWIDLAAHLLLGLVFFVFGLNKFMNFLPQPEIDPAAGAFFGALADTGYFMTVLATVEVVAGAMLLARRFVPLALVLLAPVVVHILLFHLFLAPSGTPMAVVLVVLEAYLGFVVHRASFRSVLAAKPTSRLV
jgi:uncharacterized membrane protein YphA (DoxX/SURF4 family)